MNKSIRDAFEAGHAHGERTDLPEGHNVFKLASDKYPHRIQTELFEAFMRGWYAAKQVGQP